MNSARLANLWRYDCGLFFPVIMAMHDEFVPPLCPVCREPMSLVHRIPGLGGLPELLAFYCPRCREALTVEAVSGRVLAHASAKIAA